MRRRSVIAFASIVVTAGACSSFSGNGDPPAVGDEAGAEADAPVVVPDASSPDTSPPCDVSAPFRSPRGISELNTAASEANARLSADELTIYFDRNVLFVPQIMVAARKTVSDAFSTPQPLGGVDTSFNSDGTAWVSPDNLRLLFASDRNGKQWDIFATQRATVTAQFDAPRSLDVNVPQATDYAPFVDLAGSELFFASNRDDDAGPPRIWNAPFFEDAGTGPATPVDLGAPDGGVDDLPVLSSDGLRLFFASTRGGSGVDVWQTRRASRAAAWEAPSNVAEVSTTADDAPSWLSPDGCRLYLASKIAGSWDIYVSDRSR